VRRTLLLVALGGALLAASGPAGASTTGARACGQNGLRCLDVPVPLDRTGATPGTITLHVEELPPAGTSRGFIFLIAGGPGQGSAHSFSLSSSGEATLFRFVFPDYTLVAYDDRGTGSSGLISCPGLQAAPTTAPTDQQTQLAADCAQTIGPTSQFYSTADHAEDLDAVRQAIGADTIALFGVSYGTKLALAYALAHPDKVNRILLDSVVPSDLPDPYAADVLHEMPNTLSAYCPGTTCRAATPSFSADVVALANRIEDKPMSAKVLQPNGTLKTVTINGETLLSTIIEADLDPGLAAQLPAAIHAARLGSTRPLGRVFDLTSRTSSLAAEDLSFGLYAATTCDDGRFPWAVDTPLDQRPAALQAAVAALPAGTLGPFGPWAARLGTAQFCLDWPGAGGRPLGAGPLPDVPMLALSGGLDLRTPTAGANAVAALFPQGHVLVVPGVGHSVLTSAFGLFSNCPQSAVRNWMVGGSVPASCPRVPTLLQPLAAYPTAASPKPASTMLVSLKTLKEAETTWWRTLESSAPLTVAGLAGGRLAPSKTGLGFTLTKYSLIPGVELSGTLQITQGGPPLAFQGKLTVTGTRAAAGALQVSAAGVTGVLGKQKVKGG